MPLPTLYSDFNSTVKISDTEIFDFKGFSVDHRLGVAEKSFSIDLDRPMLVTTDDTVSIEYDIGGLTYTLVNDKKIEITDVSTMQSSLRGEGSLISRMAPFRIIIFVNETWLRSVYPSAYLQPCANSQNHIIFAQKPASNPLQVNGVSTDRLFIQELPGKDVRDIDFECVVLPGISYSYVARYIAKKVGYEINCNFIETYVQKTFMVDPGMPYFDVFNRLYGNFNPMMYIDDKTPLIHILDVGGDAQERPAGIGVINFTEDSFSVLKWNVNDTQQVVDHVIITGPSTNFTYRKTDSMLRLKKSGATLAGRTQTLVDEFIYEQDSMVDAGTLAGMLFSEGVQVETDNVFEFSDPQAEKNGRQVRTVKQKVNDDSGESATIKETIETYTTSGTLVHKTETEYKWADYKTALGHTTKEWALLGTIEGGLDQENAGGYLHTSPSSKEFKFMAMTVVTFGNFIGETGMYEADTEEYHLTQYILDEDTLNDEEIYVKRRPQIVHRNSLMGVTPSTWEEKDDPDSVLGYKEGLMLTRRESIRFDTASTTVLRKLRLVEEFLPTFSRKFYPEDVPIKRRAVTEQVPRRWEFLNINGNTVEFNGGTLPTGDWHPVVSVHCPDLIDPDRARRMAKRVFAKRVRSNTSASIRLTVPVPGLKPGMIVKIPDCTKEVLGWEEAGATDFETVTIPGQYMWITGVKTRCAFSGDPSSSSRIGEIYVELDLKKNF